MAIRFIAGVLTFWVISFAAPAAVDVALLARAGTGTQAAPWTGWDTGIFWEPETEYFFRKGYYAYTVSPNFLKTGIALRGEAGTVLQFNGIGNAVVFDNPGTATPFYARWTHNVRMENFIIQGNPGATNGLFLRGVRNGMFRHISIRDVNNAGVWTEALVTNILENIRVSHHEMPNDKFNIVPAYGIVLGARGDDTTTTTTVTNPVIEGVSKIGIWIRAGSYANTFINGTSEGNLGKGMVIDGHLNNVINTDFEANGDTDVEINHASNELTGVFSEQLVDVRSGQMNKLRGRFKNVRIASICDFTDISGSFISGNLASESESTIGFGYQTPAGLVFGRLRGTLAGAGRGP